MSLARGRGGPFRGRDERGRRWRLLPLIRVRFLRWFIRVGGLGDREAIGNKSGMDEDRVLKTLALTRLRRGRKGREFDSHLLR